MTADVAVLHPEEHIRIDPARLAALYAELGAAGAETLMARAVSELALLMGTMVRQYFAGDLTAFARGLRSLRRMAGQVGMVALAEATFAVEACLDRGDPTALAATWTRCLRLGEGSLAAEWDAHGLSG